ncbi:hypothetical protein [Sedimenticola sp.]|uniref:hypothetical protein n=1 Tax=Sedimenticola sp. TaxID=1940285 RepID=UPI003D0D10F0
MIEVSKFLLLVIGEVLLLSVVYTGVVNFLAFSKRQRERAAIKKLIGRIKEDSSRRESETRKIMQERYGLSDNNLEEVVHKIAREEKMFYQTLIDVFVKRDAEAIQNLCVDYEGSVEVYRSINIPKKGESGDEGEVSEEHTEELILLKAENQRLTEELQLTMDTMGNMLSEYTLMFAGGADVSLDREKMREILTPEVSGEATPEAAEAEDDFIQRPSSEEPEQVPVSEEVVDEAVAGDSATANDELKTLDQDLDMLELSAEDLAESDSPAPSDMDETVVFSPDPAPTADDDVEDELAHLDDEVVNLDDVLDDPESRGS